MKNSKCFCRSTPIVIVENTDCYLIQETDSARVKDSSLKDAANNDKGK